MSNSKWSIYDSQIAKLIADGMNPEHHSAIARAILGDDAAYYDVTLLRTYVKRHWKRICEETGQQFTFTETKQYKSEDSPKGMFPAAKSDGSIMTIDEFCRHYKLEPSQVKSYKLVTHNGSAFYNIASHTINDVDPLEAITPEFIEELVKKHTKVKYQKSLQFSDVEFFDRLVFTDAHLGMETTSETSMYSDPWDEQAILARLEVMIESMGRYRRGNELYITDLGDFMDGYNGYTARNDHKLPQNMTTQKAFDLGVEFKLRILDAAVEKYQRVFLDNICNDNHGGTLAYLVNSAVEKIANHRYIKGEVIVRNHKKFISHFEAFNRVFVISHGKDQQFMKAGMKASPSMDNIMKIDGYIKTNGLYKYENITFDKGDSHQCILDFTTSDDFAYLSYPSFAPQSEWVQTNYKKGRSGFVIQNFDINTKVITFTPIFF